MYLVLFRYFEKKDNFPDPNTFALKELAIPVAIAALYNANVYYPRSHDVYNIMYVHSYCVQLSGTV